MPPRILVCNDDGIGAPGLRTLVEAARTLSPDVWAVAPERKWTAASHQLSFDRVLTLTRRAEREYACSGAPADCVVAAMTLLFAVNERPDLVLAGVNDKINVAEDIAYSGTMAIAREGSFWGVPAIALSRDDDGTPPATYSTEIGKLLRVLWEGRAGWSGPGYWLSLNLPQRLPASLAQARVGRDKIAAACETVNATEDSTEESTGQTTAFRIARGRPGTSTPGDERSVLASGCIALVRHGSLGDAPISRAVVDALDKSLN